MANENENETAETDAGPGAAADTGADEAGVLGPVVQRLAGVGGIVGVCLGGSRARGTHTAGSDYDLGLYYRPGQLDTGALREVAAELGGRPVEVTEPGGWGPWVDGGAWLDIGPARVDWIYRDVQRVRHYAAEARHGRYVSGQQPGHPYGVPSYAYVGELALARVLADPDGELAALRGEIGAFPAELTRTLEADAAWEAPFALANARKGARRGDAGYVAGCLFRAVGLLVHALHARAGQWLVNEKGAIASAGRLPCAPPEFERRAQELFAPGGTDPASLAAVLDRAEELAREVLAGAEGTR
ncbi:nucleotidyltransferase domain-containing protein [Kitasatospora sp. YST-16]|uniref:nucleotidyltransferase domain-containing protein n=1 Tax=Kitasatospora sp. YST-16 TaxID=2998080 RepID=UPI002285120C|nr:nucleotidyltransferase domain-containing protein [Kitasatospora sp. YST-16]WAL70589.1 nucleotidyltransferase domain-containing protein [Kitasatospora sp. YST-16]WNW36630.1 nucleotidyltransferase domain-containing protein [Streptomyces sp. Li-HN-5-13]